MIRQSSLAAAGGLLLGLMLSGCAMNAGQPRLANPDPASNPPSTAGDRAPPADGVIAVRPGDTVYAIARQYGLSPRTIIEANRLAPPYLLHVGDRLFLPVPRVHVVKPGDTLSDVARIYRIDFERLVALNDLRPPYAIRVGQRLRLPGAAGGAGGTVVAARSPQSPPQPVPSPPAAADPSRPWSSDGSLNFPVAAPRPPATAPGAPPQPQPRPADPAASGGVVIAQAPPPPPPAPPAAVPPATAPPAAAPSAAAEPPQAPDAAADSAVRAAILSPPARSASRFMWPVEGRVIAGFGPRQGGLHNDGINIAANAGTEIRAAENGVVVYAGNELRGFGNLLLIKHADGWTTAYAHADRLLVRRGDRVARGQPIATVGQTGNVDRPQLHFEIRKGPRAVDPRDELAAARSSGLPAAAKASDLG